MNKISVIRQQFYPTEEGLRIGDIDQQLVTFLNKITSYTELAVVSVQQTDRQYAQKNNPSTNTSLVEFLITFSGEILLTPLNQIPYETLDIGDKLISMTDGTTGHIMNLYKRDESIENDIDNLIVKIYWDKSNEVSDTRWCFLSKVLVVG